MLNLLVLIQYFADIRSYISQIISSFKVIQINMLSNLQIWKFASGQFHENGPQNTKNETFVIHM